MAAPRAHLARAPAREALIDIQFEPRLPIEAVQAFAKLAEPEFRRNLDLWESVIGFGTAGGAPGASATNTPIGKRLDSKDPPHVLQCRVNGFTFSRLSPYGRWEDLRFEAHRWWTSFRSAVHPGMVTRIAVRYINEIKLPLPIGDFSEFLTSP